MHNLTREILSGIAMTIILLFFLVNPATSVDIPDSPCNVDCTTYDNTCAEECDNVNGCVYNNIFVDKYGLTIKQVCNLQKKGWTRFFNDTHNLVCCTGGFQERVEEELVIETNATLEDIATLSRYISLNGKMVTMHISVWR